MKAALYVRVSTEEQSSEGFSIPAQLKALKEYCLKNGIDIFKEFIDAHWNRDEVEMLDGCMDLIWVTLGFCHMKGYDVVGAWDEVLKSNMAKVDPVTRKVKRREDGKILKPEGWKPPDLSKFTTKKLP